MLMVASIVFGTLILCEILRVGLYFVCGRRRKGTLTVLIDGTCVVCNGLRVFTAYRSEEVKFESAQTAVKNQTRWGELCARKFGSERLLDRLLVKIHAVDSDDNILTGHVAILALLDRCDAPYPFIAWLARIFVPSFLAEAMYGVFSRNRHKWFGLSMGEKNLEDVDDEAKFRQAMKQGLAMASFAVVGMTFLVLPFGDGKKDGPPQQLTRYFVAAAIFFVGAYLFSEEQGQRKSFEQRALSFQEKYVGRASAASLAVMRVTCAVILYVFTLTFMTTPLARSAETPRFMCKPTGILRLLGIALPSLFGPSALLASAARLAFLEAMTRTLLACVAVGFLTPVTAPTAAMSWLIYGGVLRSYNTWRGHSFMAAWWTLVVLSLRGGSGDSCSVDALLFGRKKSSPAAAEIRFLKLQAAERGWTRFMATLVFATNYFMAGLSKFCASGIAWAAGSNLKAKLLQTSLTQGSFGVYLSLGFRHFPTPFWAFLGFCGLYGELAMGLVPFEPLSKLLFPTLMWGMHVGIIGLQHIVFVDLLTMIPAWYFWHYIDGLENPLYKNGPWDWRHVSRQAYDKVLGTKFAAVTENDDLEDQQKLLPEGTKEDAAVASRGAMRSILLMFVFVFVWMNGAEWYPWNSFRMFADWTPNPIDYERYVALDATKQHLRNFHMHEINPVLNRKRFVDALDLCATGPATDDCQSFLKFIHPIASALPEHPSFLVVETRLWDFVNDIDKSDYCDSMTTYVYDVNANAVTVNYNQPCDPIDWQTCCTSSIGTI